MSTDNNLDMPLEQERLSNTRDYIVERIDSLRDFIDHNKRAPHDRVEYEVRKHRKEELERMEDSYPEPYFGRLKVKRSGEEFDIYIGKFHIDGPVFVCSVWDNKNIFGQIFHQGTIDEDTEVFLKRHIDNKDGIILKIYDTIKEEVFDEYLKVKLSAHSSNRMSDIVATLQKQQDTIIRQDFNTVMIMQGVAGSGKTAIALHRIAYLIYNYKEKLKDILVLGPNQTYLKYISNLLPSLGVKNARQTIFRELAKDLCKIKDVPASAVPNKDDSFIAKIKEFIKESEEKFFNEIPDFTVRYGDRDEPYKLQREYLEQFPINKRTTEYEKYLRDQIISHTSTRQTGKSVKGQKKTRVTSDYILYQPRVKAYLSKWPTISVDHLISAFYAKHGELSLDDHLAVRLILTMYVEGLPTFDHIVMDEAQELPPVAFYAVTKLQSKSRSMTILGDVCQKCEEDFFSWEIFREIIGGKTEFYVLRQSYRSTDNIVEACNSVLGYILNARDYEKYSALPIGRVGEDVSLLEVASFDLAKVINEINPSDNLVAVICKDSDSTLKTFNDIKNLNPLLISGNVTDYGEKGTVIMTVEQSRGLEFDAVIIPDVYLYGNNNKDIKTLYLAMSRAMHKLVICYSKRVPEFLSDLFKKVGNTVQS